MILHGPPNLRKIIGLSIIVPLTTTMLFLSIYTPPFKVHTPLIQLPHRWRMFVADHVQHTKLQKIFATSSGKQGAVSSNYFLNFKIYNETIPMDTSSREEKLILIHTMIGYHEDWLDDIFWREKEQNDLQFARPGSGFNCSPHRCALTRDKNLSDSAHAIFFSYMDAPCNLTGLPRRASPDQVWVGYSFEGGAYDYLHNRQHCPFNRLVNWTASHRRDSDVYWPYGYLEKKLDADAVTGRSKILTSDDQNFSGNFTSKKLAFALVSNNGSENGRENLIKSLQKLVPIDIFGDAGVPCPVNQSETELAPDSCRKYLAPQYKFYLAFENSHCQDYVTEKFFESLQLGVIPIVYGLANYARIGPPHSYIDVLDFPSVRHLANYLTHLDKNESEYLKYFEWRKAYTVQVSLERSFCGICTQLWNPHGICRKEYSNFYKWLISRWPNDDLFHDDKSVVNIDHHHGGKMSTKFLGGNNDQSRLNIRKYLKERNESCTNMKFWLRDFIGREKPGSKKGIHEPK